MADPSTREREGLRVDVTSGRVRVVPGEPAEVTLLVRNQSPVIETVDVAVEGLDAEVLSVEPARARLFPEERVEVVVRVAPAAGLRAGQHDGRVVVTGESGASGPARAPIGVEVPPVRAATLTAEPPLRTGRRRTVFALAVANTGNAPLTAQLRARDGNQRLDLTLDRPVVSVEPGTSELVELQARGPRPWFGADVETPITVLMTAEDVEDEAGVRFRQRPRLTPGVVTVLTLALIGLLWAAAVLFGVTTALAPPEETKVLPTSFSALTEDGGPPGIGLADLDPAAVGGSLAGTVTATSTGLPLARITVEARDADGDRVGATATDDDGSFSLDGLLPSRYRLVFSADGYEDLWWPGVAGPADAEPLTVSPTEPREDLDVALVGRPSSLAGSVVTGLDAGAVAVTVRVEALDLAEEEPAVEVPVDADGNWVVRDLTAPATYSVRLLADGFAPIELTQPVAPGAELLAGTIRLPAALGEIVGTVVDLDGTPIGGVEIEATNGETTLTTTTPTSGEVGTFRLPDLETPATYLLTLRAEGRASETVAVRLGAGEPIDDLEIVLAPSNGVVTGRVTDPAGLGLGAVTVTVRGGETVLSTETFTSGEVGSFRVGGVPVPGRYAVTFTLDGRRTQTVATTLSPQEPTATISVSLPAADGRLAGTVVDAEGVPVPGALVEVSDGATVLEATTASDPLSQRGRFVLEGLEPGAYTVTVTTPDDERTIVLATVTAGSTTRLTVTTGSSA